jgi:2-polyprenyl-3-methyl-5-hydroxy-6-metoxy-1,4-benzoquinol methylase
MASTLSQFMEPFAPISVWQFRRKPKAPRGSASYQSSAQSDIFYAMSRNVTYTTSEIARFYGAHRRRWDEFYPSERWIFERVAASREGLGSVLDAGCAVGGLGEALASQFQVTSYTGVDISAPAIALAARRAKEFPVPAEFHAGDICNCPALGDRKFDLVCALSVVDWNIDATGTLRACWNRVVPGGRLVASLRLTPEATVCDATRSYQFIWFEPGDPPSGTETAQYTVLNVADALKMLGDLSPVPAEILAYGYWGKPSSVARTPFDRLLFSVIAVTKPSKSEMATEPRLEVHWPVDVFVRQCSII